MLWVNCACKNDKIPNDTNFRFCPDRKFPLPSARLSASEISLGSRDTDQDHSLDLCTSTNGKCCGRFPFVA